MLSLNNTTNSARHSTHFPFCYKMNQSINQPTRERMKDRPCLQTNLKRGKKKITWSQKNSAISKDVFIFHRNLVYK